MKQRTISRHNSYTQSTERSERASELKQKSKKDLGRAALTVLATAFVAAKGGTAAYEMVKDDSDQFENDKVSVSEISIEDGARFRSEPAVPSKDEAPNILTTTNFGDLAGSDATLSFAPGEDVYKVETVNNGTFYGVSTEDLSLALPNKADELSKDKDGIIWVSEQRASVTLEDEADR